MNKDDKTTMMCNNINKANEAMQVLDELDELIETIIKNNEMLFKGEYSETEMLKKIKEKLKAYETFFENVSLRNSYMLDNEIEA